MQEEIRELAKKSGRTFAEVLELWDQAKSEVYKRGVMRGSNVSTKKAKDRLYELAMAPKPEAPKPEAPKPPAKPAPAPAPAAPVEEPKATDTK